MSQYHQILVLVEGTVNESDLQELADDIADHEDVAAVFSRQGMSATVKLPNFPAPDTVQ